MTNSRIVNLNGVLIGRPDANANRVLNENGKVLFLLRGNQLISTKNGEEYRVLNDGRIVNQRNQQVAFFYDFAGLKRAAASAAKQPDVSRAVPPQQTRVHQPASAPRTAADAKPAAQEKHGHPILALVAVAAIVFLFFTQVMPALSGIQGTWVVTAVEESEDFYGGSDYEQDIEEDDLVEIHFKKGGAFALTTCTGTTPGEWYKSDSNTYILTFKSVGTQLLGSNNSTKATLENGRLVMYYDDSVVTLKKK